MVGITNVTNVSMEDILQITNFTTPADMFLYVNEVIYGGWMFYMLMWVLAIILFVTAQGLRKEPMSNALYSFGIVSIISIFARSVQAYYQGNWISMLTDFQFWTFPLITSLLGSTMWAIKRD